MFAFLPIAAMDDTTAMFVIGYIVGVAISVYTLTSVPKVDGMPLDLEQRRTAIIVVGFLPCCWIGPLFQLAALANYKYRTARLASPGRRDVALRPPGEERRRRDRPAAGAAAAGSGHPRRPRAAPATAASPRRSRAGGGRLLSRVR